MIEFFYIIGAIFYFCIARAGEAGIMGALFIAITWPIIFFLTILGKVTG